MERKQEVRFLTITFALVMTMGGASLYSLMTIPAPTAQTGDINRNPASLPSAQQVNDKPATNWSKLEAFDWDCKLKAEATPLSATHIRIKGKPFCRGHKLQDLKIANKTNGFTASVFINEKGFMTDFIDLKQGRNHLTFEWRDHKGKATIAELLIDRN